MNKITQLLSFLFVLGIYAMPLHSQQSLKVAEKLMQFGEYQQASTHLSKYIKENAEDANAMLMLADCNFLMNRNYDAVTWYERYSKVVTHDQSFYINYGLSLKKSGRYSEAKNIFLKYNGEMAKTAKHYAESCTIAIELMQQGSDIKAQNLAFNSEKCEFSTTIWRNKLVHCSYAPQMLNNDAMKAYGQTSGFGLMTTDMNGENDNMLFNGLGFQYNRGPITLFGNKCAYSVYGISEYQSARPISSSIYLAEVSDEDVLSNVSTFPYNGVGVINCDPHLTNGGKTLFFSSNRPEGFGGFDLYVSRFHNGSWTSPVNLGNEINSSGNEITPAILGDKMYFSSDYHSGLGGYDIFTAQQNVEGWYNVQNAGAGINSSSNDYFPCPFGKQLYFTSQRLTSKGGDDIFVIQLPDRDKIVGLGLITDEKTSSLINFNTDIASEGNIPKAVDVSNYMPNAKMNNLPNTSVKVVRNKSGKVEQNITLKSEEILSANTEQTPPPAFRIPNFSNKSGNMDEIMGGARQVSLKEVMGNKKTIVHFIQVAAMYGTRPNFDKYKPLTKYGNVYKVFINKAVKIRVGYYDSVDEAQNVLALIRGEGFKDAFLVSDDLTTSELELVLSGTEAFNGPHSQKSFGYNTPTTTTTPSKTTVTPTAKTPSPAPAPAQNNTPITAIENGSEYKVRLVSYEDPIWFESSKVKDLGKIEHWKKGTWTIFILSGYKTFEEADSARIKAINRGYVDAEVVIDNGGIIERLKKN